jgi:2-iminobutanoate/2-iminopropanoate deaminase
MYMSAQAFGPYTPILQAGDLYFVAGQVGVDPETKKAGKTIQEQTSQALTNLAAILDETGLDMQDVVKTTVYLTNMDDYDAMNGVYVGHFRPPRPARAAVAVRELPRVGGETTLLVEIEAIAMKGAE